MYKVLGYGAGLQPLNKGVEMATCKDIGTTMDIVKSLMMAHQGQWFGYSRTDHIPTGFSTPMRWMIESAK